jgi:malate dehydrogenase (oxaloacetate-decarboxylating)(NADP+)
MWRITRPPMRWPRATRITDEMFMAAAHTLAEKATRDDLQQGSLYPPLTNIREVSAHIAASVATVAYYRKLARGAERSDLLAFMKAQMYGPGYVRYVGE